MMRRRLGFGIVVAVARGRQNEICVSDGGSSAGIRPSVRRSHAQSPWARPLRTTAAAPSSGHKVTTGTKTLRQMPVRSPKDTLHPKHDGIAWLRKFRRASLHLVVFVD